LHLERRSARAVSPLGQAHPARETPGGGRHGKSGRALCGTPPTPLVMTNGARNLTRFEKVLEI